MEILNGIAVKRRNPLAANFHKEAEMLNATRYAQGRFGLQRIDLGDRFGGSSSRLMSPTKSPDPLICFAP
jgi:hypothetical protein